MLVFRVTENVRAVQSSYYSSCPCPMPWEMRLPPVSPEIRLQKRAAFSAIIGAVAFYEHYMTPQSALLNCWRNLRLPDRCEDDGRALIIYCTVATAESCCNGLLTHWTWRLRYPFDLQSQATMGTDSTWMGGKMTSTLGTVGGYTQILGLVKQVIPPSLV
jgi:hypothetical protein